MEKVPTTAEGLKHLEDELKQLKSIERPAIIKAIAAVQAGALDVAPLQSYFKGTFEEQERRVRR